MVIPSFPCGNAQVQMFWIGMLQNNVYMVSREGSDEVLVVDPSEGCDVVMEALGDCKVAAIMLTHYHTDHTSTAAELRRRTNAPVIASEADAPYIEMPVQEVGFLPMPEPCPVDIIVQDGQEIEVAGLTWQVMITPGHSKGSMCWYLPPEQTDGFKGILLSGDTLFAGSTGRTDFDGGSNADMKKSILRLAELPDDTIVLPGHNQLTTIKANRDPVFKYFTLIG